jgi:hypothetical protein
MTGKINKNSKTHPFLLIFLYLTIVWVLKVPAVGGSTTQWYTRLHTTDMRWYKIMAFKKAKLVFNCVTAQRYSTGQKQAGRGREL